MLPFLKKKNEVQSAGLIVKTREPDEKPEQEMEQDDGSIAIEACAQELIRAVHAKDAKAAANAIKDAFDILDSMPHVEGEHVEPHSYEAQNIKAAKGEY